jgi:hypothetical protein
MPDCSSPGFTKDSGNAEKLPVTGTRKRGGAYLVNGGLAKWECCSYNSIG